MTSTPYLSITPPKSIMLNVTRGWMLLAVLSLALAGVLSILLVVLRTPGVEAMIPYHGFFHTALVAHVDLSVLVWMLSIGGLLWSMITHPSYYTASLTAVILATVGSILIAVTPFTGESYPLMNNYIPVLQRLPFFLGLSLVGCGVLFQVVTALLSYQYISSQSLVDNKNPILEMSGIYVAAIITLVAFICFILSWQQLQHVAINEIQYYYEQLFWGGGHILQFTYTQLMVVVWFMLAIASGITPMIHERWLHLLLSFNLTVVFASPLLYFFYPVASPEYTEFFTEQMRYMGGAAAAIAGLILAKDLYRQWDEVLFSPSTGALICSLALFGMGGVIGHLIHGMNVTIPAHYHGSIVGISLAFMGLVYHIAPKLGFGDIKGKAACIQPFVYGGGQLLHITGLAWSGGYGALRKTPGVALSPEAKAGMALMGSGGLIAVIGGVMFVIIVLKALLVKKNDEAR